MDLNFKILFAMIATIYLTVYYLNFSDIAIITVKNVNYCCIVHNISKCKVIHLFGDSVLDDSVYLQNT